MALRTYTRSKNTFLKLYSAKQLTNGVFFKNLTAQWKLNELKMEKTGYAKNRINDLFDTRVGSKGVALPRRMNCHSGLIISDKDVATQKALGNES